MIFSILKNWFVGTNKLERFWLMAKIEFKLRYYENKLGLLWALVKPVSDMIVYYIAFGLIMKTGFSQYVSFLLLGLILWNFFVESTTGTTQILSTKKYLYEYTNMNKIEIYLSVIGSNLIGLFFNLIVFFTYYSLFEKDNAHISWHSIFIIPIILNLALLSLAFSLILSTIYILAKDINQIWAIVIGLAFWISPIIYKPAIFQNSLPGLDYINPISSIIINARNTVMYHQIPNWHLFGWGFGYATFFLLIGLYLLNTLGAKAAEKL